MDDDGDDHKYDVFLPDWVEKMARWWHDDDGNNNDDDDDAEKVQNMVFLPDWVEKMAMLDQRRQQDKGRILKHVAMMMIMMVMMTMIVIMTIMLIMMVMMIIMITMIILKCSCKYCQKTEHCTVLFED